MKGMGYTFCSSFRRMPESKCLAGIFEKAPDPAFASFALESRRDDVLLVGLLMQPCPHRLSRATQTDRPASAQTGGQYSRDIQIRDSRRDNVTVSLARPCP